MPHRLLISFIVIIIFICVLHAQSKRRRPNKTEDDEVPLPDPFPIPKHFRTNVEEALKSGKIATKERRMFLSDIASAMLRYKRYPTKEDYINVGCAVIQAYPFLKSTTGRPYASFIIAVSV